MFFILSRRVRATSSKTCSGKIVVSESIQRRDLISISTTDSFVPMAGSSHVNVTHRSGGKEEEEAVESPQSKTASDDAVSLPCRTKGPGGACRRFRDRDTC